MNTGGEAADQVIRMSLNGMEVAARISGKAAIEVANMLYAVMKDQKKTKGKTRLENLINTGKPLTVFTLKADDLASFQKEAKKYGILYYAVRNQRANSDGMVDIMVKTEDSPRVNRIVERFKLVDVSQSAYVKTDIEQAKENRTKNKESSKELKSTEEIKEQEDSSNPNLAKTIKSHRSEPIFNPVVEGSNEQKERPSVRAELKQIKSEMEKETTNVNKEEVKFKKPTMKQMEHKQPIHKKKKVKER